MSFPHTAMGILHLHLPMLFYSSVYMVRRLYIRMWDMLAQGARRIGKLPSCIVLISLSSSIWRWRPTCGIFKHSAGWTLLKRASFEQRGMKWMLQRRRSACRRRWPMLLRPRSVRGRSLPIVRSNLLLRLPLARRRWPTG